MVLRENSGNGTMWQRKMSLSITTSGTISTTRPPRTDWDRTPINAYPTSPCATRGSPCTFGYGLDMVKLTKIKREIYKGIKLEAS